MKIPASYRPQYAKAAFAAVADELDTPERARQAALAHHLAAFDRQVAAFQTALPGALALSKLFFRT